MTTPTNAWSAPSPHLAAAQPAGGEELSLQTRPMGLKVHYSFDRDNQVQCLARWPHILQIQTLALDQHTTIGLIDLRTCLQAVVQSSPEILNQENDYTVYSYDYSEPNVPLVGQGMLSWNLASQRDPQQQLTTGRVTRNLLALLNNGSRDTLEVRLKFTAVARPVRRTDDPSTVTVNETRSPKIPADTASEWNALVRSNSMLGHGPSVSAVSSPALAPAQLSHPPQQSQPASLPPANDPTPASMLSGNGTSSVAPTPAEPQGSADNAPSPAIPQATEAMPRPRSSRPASRSRQPTGRPRGRPRKKPQETGNTSAAEEATDGDEGPQRKRIKVIRTEYPAIAPFGAVPDSLRVAASTSGSLRTMRPVGAGGVVSAANHLQDVPRAPTPIPDGPLLQQHPRRRVFENLARSESMTSMDQPGSGRSAAQNPSQDARSPAGSIAPSPDHGYSPEGSAGDLGSSPPVPRNIPYMRSSPPVLSPVLSTLPMSQADSGFMSGGFDDLFDDVDMLHNLPQRQTQDQMLPVPPLPVPSKPNRGKNGRAQQQEQQPNFPFQEENPGPPELLPVKSIFNPAGKAKALNRHTAAASAQSGPKKSNGAASSAQPSSHAAGSGFTEVSQQESGPTSVRPMPVPERPEPEPVLPAQPASRPGSRGLPASDVPVPAVPAPAVPASDPVANAAAPVLTLPRAVASEAPCPPSDLEPPRYSKNLVKKQSIKERLEIAIEKGESPPFCNNCGAIETPTWRKIWTRDFDGQPEFHEFSDKPGCVTMVEVLVKDPDGLPSKYRMVKKNLGPKDDKKQWVETILCNPCGIWLAKFRAHRPPERWDKDAARLNAPRRKRDSKANNSRSKKSRTKSDAQANPTSEAYFTTDPVGPAGDDSPKVVVGAIVGGGGRAGACSEQQGVAVLEDKPLNFQRSPRRFMGSTHSRGSGTADSPIAVEDDDLGSTRRLLFPSPRRDGVPKVLGELALNTVHTGTHAPETKSAAAGEEGDSRQERSGTPVRQGHDDLEQELFGTPPKRPSTPPPKASGPFKTPTRPTPSHRPITRSISRSIRSVRSIPRSPSQLLPNNLLQTPSKTPRPGYVNGGGSSSSKRRTPRSTTAHLHAHFVLDGQEQQMQMEIQYESPFTATLHQLLSEANDFITGSPSRVRAEDLDLSNLQQLQDVAGQNHEGHDAATMDFGSFLGTDLIMPDSPPLVRSAGKAAGNGTRGDGGNSAEQRFGGVLQEEEAWAQQLQHDVTAEKGRMS
ncbi:hypothetical protein C8A03DRAFT_29571 [Achaetomium macrosporum]|uniref:Ams2/SPT21 N-terminal domain-containing protein n=1 Tax=Achaetomium macrosporum TaxID=79813 RepID=A0AAN7CHQ5_9PEZI|nr:hypothetical protein C8A03DRAFT_29571 [Achaetomium macrosporum]